MSHPGAHFDGHENILSQRTSHSRASCHASSGVDVWALKPYSLGHNRTPVNKLCRTNPFTGKTLVPQSGGVEVEEFLLILLFSHLIPIIVCIYSVVLLVWPSPPIGPLSSSSHTLTQRHRTSIHLWATRETLDVFPIPLKNKH